ncbi:MAG: hypothetical protein LBU58_10870 [Clostridiales bacterium]|nr:hypothetical protein [Clostridiales bacterium]
METTLRDAPDVGAFYFQDAVGALKEAGFTIGRIEFTLPPRERRRAEGLAASSDAAAGETAGAAVSADACRALFDPRAGRVVRCSVRDGQPRVADILLSPDANAIGGYAVGLSAPAPSAPAPSTPVLSAPAPREGVPS